MAKVLTLTATAYGPSRRDNYPYGPCDIDGNPLQVGDVAVDPSVIPIGTRLFITGYRCPLLPPEGLHAVARDTGGAIRGDRIDIFLDASPPEVADFGIQTVQAVILDGG
jgi:3D (Asp-Asp-Asp) domain-containing protein